MSARLPKEQEREHEAYQQDLDTLFHKRQTRPWYRRASLWVPVGIVLLLTGIRIALTPLARHYTQDGLNSAEEFKGELEDVSISLFRGSYTITKLKLTEQPATEKKKPLVYAETVEARISWASLFRFRLVAAARIDHAKVNLRVKTNEGKKTASKTPEIPDVDEALHKIFPFRVDRLAVHDSEVLLVDVTEPNHPEVWLHGIEVAFENFGTRKYLTKGEPTTLAISAILQRSGRISVFCTADLFEEVPTFAGEAKLTGFKLNDLYAFVAPLTGMQFSKGTLDVFVQFKSTHGRISGGVKPMLKNLDIEPAENTFGNRVRVKLSDTALHLFSDRVPGRDAVATVIPIEGRLLKPDVQLVPTVIGVVRNAFVEGVSSGFDRLPPPKSGERQGVLAQAKQGLSKDKEAPKAQPAPSEEKKK